jgi:hypothetical protein
MAAQVRSILIYDVHLGTRACQADRLLDFLREHPSEYLFMLGDIVDFWAMSRGGIYWSAAQNTVVQKVLRRARHGTKVFFIPGNHDEAMREYVGTSFGDIQVEYEYVHAACSCFPEELYCRHFSAVSLQTYFSSTYTICNSVGQLKFACVRAVLSSGIGYCALLLPAWIRCGGWRVHKLE